jgi:transposase, IS30 family
VQTFCLSITTKNCAMSYTHLSLDERYQISFLLQTQHNIRAIANNMNRSPSTISREIMRNSVSGKYQAIRAHELYADRQSLNAYTIPDDLWGKVCDKLSIQQSPEQIAGQLRISHEVIYQRIYQDKANGGALHKNLRCQKKKRKRYGSGQDRRGQMPNICRIQERPEHVERRLQVGHWEGDTVIGRNHQQAVVTLVERRSGYALIEKVENKTAELVTKAIIGMLGKVSKRVKSITFDNGKEFAWHGEIAKALKCKTYFADPYRSWQRGSNENYNGLLRQYIPKLRRMEEIEKEELIMIENRLNNRPRKRLGYKSPSQIFTASLRRVALHT